MIRLDLSGGLRKFLLGAFVLLGVVVLPVGDALGQSSVAPEISSAGPFALDEGATAVATLTATDGDTALGDLTWSILGGGDHDKFTLSSDGVLAFAAAKDYENPDDVGADGVYEVAVQVSDGDNTDTADLVVTLENVVELSAITGPTTVTFAENAGTRVATFSASSEQDRHGVEWTLTGDDAADFSIDTPPGVLRFDIDPVAPRAFAELPDFEVPKDSDTNGSYQLSLRARVGTETSSLLSVTVTVSDEDEDGAVSLSAKRPRLGSALTATLSDPDGVTAATTSWVWERSAGRNKWATIDGATSASYPPVAADAGEYLRVTATYTDDHDAGQAAQAVTPNVVTAQLLSSLVVTTDNSTASAAYALKPAFEAETLHYVVGCSGDGYPPTVTDDTMTLTPSAPSGARLSVNGEQVASGSSIDVPVHSDSDVSVTVASSDGASTTYVVRCIYGSLWHTEATKNPNSADVMEDLIMFVRDPWAAIVDNNGVPRFRTTRAKTGYFRVHPVGDDGAFRYSYYEHPEGKDPGWTVRGQDLEKIGDPVTTVGPLRHTDAHDFRILENGDDLLMSYEYAQRDLSGLSFQHRLVNAVQPQAIRDSAIQIVTPGPPARATFNWNSWDAIPLEDCAQHHFPDGYAHVNSLQMVDGNIVASFRGCSTVLRIDPDLPGKNKVVWRLGRSNLSAEQWSARSLGPSPLTMVNDPAGEFCGQHAAEILPNGNLILFDNGVVCLRDPWQDAELGRQSDVYSRVVEYAIDVANGEAIFRRDHSLHDSRALVGYAQGHVDVLSNGDWLISWGNHRNGSSVSTWPDVAVTQVDPDTHEEKFSLSLKGIFRTTQQYGVRASPLPPHALAREPSPLAAQFPASGYSSVFHGGPTDSPKVVVAFDQPVADLTAATPSVAVVGAEVTSVVAHVADGEPANAYLFTLMPTGTDPITFSLAADVPCASGGVCTAGGTMLSAVPLPLVIGPPVAVSFERAAHGVEEGSALSVVVQLGAAHRGVRGVTVPVVSAAASSASADDFTVTGSVTFDAGETQKTLTFRALHDDLVEGPETVDLEFGSLPHAMTAGTNAESTVAISDVDRAQISFTAAVDEVAEGGEISLVFSITNGVTFAEQQTLGLALSGTATPGDDFTLTTSNREDVTSSTSMILPADAGSVRLALVAATDQEEDPDETVEVSISHESNRIGTVTVTIADAVPTPAPLRPNAQGATGGGGSGGGGGGGDLDVGVATFVVANGWSPADVGVAAVLAARTSDAVVVYTAGDELSAETAMLLRDASPAEVVIVGGTAAVSRDVRTQIRAASSESGISRITGADRADTAAGTARRILGVPSQAGRVTLIVANGWSPPDIGAAAALAARSGRSAVIYTQAARLPEASAALLRDYQVARVILIGGTAAISAEVAAQATAAAGSDASISRLTGADRVDTAAQTARRVLGNAASAPDGITLVIANGWSAPDVGVAAALAAATENAAVAYTSQGTLPAATAELIRDYRPSQVIIVGGRAAVTNEVRAAITEAAPSSTDVRRITGTTRTDTAATVARRILGSP